MKEETRLRIREMLERCKDYSAPKEVREQERIYLLYFIEGLTIEPRREKDPNNS